ncbi:hypothetical protein Plhal304r1_c025g0083901 [Plasmopara halstedii]
MSPSSTVTFQRDGLLPLVDASGAQRWIVERIVDHDLLQCRSSRAAQTELPHPAKQGRTLSRALTGSLPETRNFEATQPLNGRHPRYDEREQDDTHVPSRE